MNEAKEVKKNGKKLTTLQIAVLAFLLGMFVLVAVRFASIKDTSVHYHANFAVYVDGKKDEFKSFTFYEEVQSCSIDDANNVKTKAHMHDQNPALVHVHQAGVTWGQFFANLGYGLSNKALTTDAGVFVDEQNDKQLTFILNGQPVRSIANEVIKSEDTLLINYGNEDNETIQTRADSIPHDADEANTKNDPSSCSGSHKLTFTDRLKSALGITQSTSHH